MSQLGGYTPQSLSLLHHGHFILPAPDYSLLSDLDLEAMNPWLYGHESLDQNQML